MKNLHIATALLAALLLSPSCTEQEAVKAGTDTTAYPRIWGEDRFHEIRPEFYYLK